MQIIFLLNAIFSNYSGTIYSLSIKYKNNLLKLIQIPIKYSGIGTFDKHNIQTQYHFFNKTAGLKSPLMKQDMP